jgi:hypothetical protein
VFVAPREGTRAVPHGPTNAETPFASYFDVGRPRILICFLTAVFFQPKVVEKVAGRARKDRNVVLRFVAPRKGANEVLLDPTSAETQFASYFDFGQPRILRFFLTAVFSKPKCPQEGRGRTET